MDYESEIQNEEGAITRLKSELRATRLPQRTISWQHNNLGQTRGITQRILVVRKKRNQIKSKIKSSEGKIMSLRKVILGV